MADHPQISIMCESCTKIFRVKPERLRRANKTRFCSLDCRKYSNAPARFWRHVEKRGPDDCWPWTGAGRGRGILFDGEYFHAHSVAFRLTYGRWPKDGRQSCANRNCANPAHVIDVAEAA
jgi:hypothetical protein